MLASLELNAGLELVVRAQPRGLITIEHGLGGDAIELSPPISLTLPLEIPVTTSR